MDTVKGRRAPQKMKKDVVVTIVDKHYSDGEWQTAELMTSGTLLGSGENYTLSYDERDAELENCRTVLRVEGEERITMTRKGRYAAHFVLEKGKRHNCHYATPHGELLMGIYTGDIVSRMTPSGGRLEFRYTIDFDASFSSENELYLTVKEADSNVCFGE